LKFDILINFLCVISDIIIIVMAGFAKKKYFRLAKGFMGRAKNCLRITIPKVEKALQKAYIGRKLRKRTLRRNWIQQINAAARDLNINYSRFICGLNRSNIELDRKILADLAQNEPFSFKAVIDEVVIQNEITNKQRYYKLDEMIKRNLITSAKMKKEDYRTQPKNLIRIKSIGDKAA
jgi:large subunit ribosomal protein L20